MGWSSGWTCDARRAVGALIWIPLVLVGPLVHLPADAAGRWAGVALLAVVATAAAAVLLDAAPWTSPRARIAFAVLAAGVAAGTGFGSGWLPAWVLLAIVTPAVLRARWLVAALVVEVAGSGLAAWAVGDGITAVQVETFVVALSGATAASFVRLVETVGELHRTRAELARLAVADERERFSRDLHDLLGHTLSVMVVKAQAVRRLAHTDPDQVVAHAIDIEQVGREALGDVRRTVDALRRPTLAEELDGARRALDAAGIETVVVGAVDPAPEGADEVLAWVVREGATNVLRHAAATHCRIELAHGARGLVLTIADDGVGGPRPDDSADAAGAGWPDRQGGLDGLRRRLAAAGGRLEAGPGPDGFRLTAALPRVDEPVGARGVR